MANDARRRDKSLANVDDINDNDNDDDGDEDVQFLNSMSNINRNE